MPKQLTSEIDCVVLSVRIPRAILAIIRQSALANDRTVTAELVSAARQRAKQFQAEQQAAGERACATADRC